MRLGKHLAHAGVASRRASEALIVDGRVTVDGAVVTDPARGVTGEEAIAVDGELVRGPGTRVVYALHKPAGVVSTAADTHGRPTVVDLVPTGQRLYPVGRLDADSTGPDPAHQRRRPRLRAHPSALRGAADLSGARSRGAPSERALRALREGIELDDGRTAPAHVRLLGPHELELTIHEGRKRQVRRMCEAVGHRVVDLRRVAFGSLRLGDLAAGRHRRLTAAEVERLRKDARGSRARA